VYAAMATEPGQADKQNEDWAGVSPNVAVLLDGLSSTRDTESGCQHGTPWFVNQLGIRLLVEARDPERTLQDALATAIDQVSKLHPMCDLTHPGSPSTTVATLRKTSNYGVEYLILADARVVFEGPEGVQVVTDERVDSVAGAARDAVLREPIGSSEHRLAITDLIATQQPFRNRPDGYWIAAADPAVAAQALTGSVRSATIDHAALLSDGASRLVDTFEAATWEQTLTLARKHGPDHVIARVREIERSDPTGQRWPRYKTSDDATFIYIRW